MNVRIWYEDVLSFESINERDSFHSMRLETGFLRDGSTIKC